jgi:hypothetical protein
MRGAIQVKQGIWQVGYGNPRMKYRDKNKVYKPGVAGLKDINLKKGGTSYDE